MKLNLLTKTKSFAFSRHFIKTINLNYGYIAKPFKISDISNVLTGENRVDF
jgi:hypothetical protein